MRDPELALKPARPVETAPARLFGDSLNRREALRLLSYGSLLMSDLTAIQAGFAIASHLRGAYWLQLYGLPVSILFGLTYAVMALGSGSVTREAFGSRLRSAMLGERTLLMASALCIAFLFFQPQGLTLSRLALLTAIVLSGLFIGSGRMLFLTLFLPNRADFWTSRIILLDGAPAPPGRRGTALDVMAEGINPERSDPRVVARLGAILAGYNQVVVICTDTDRAHAWSLMLKSFDIRAEVLMPSDLPIGALGVGRFADRPTLIVNRGQLTLADRVKKRIVDLLFSAIALLILAPVLVLVALAIRLDSPGPVLFRQLRVGYPHFLVTEDTVLGRSLAAREEVLFVPHFALGQGRMGKLGTMLGAALRSAWQSLRIVRKRRPDVIITTGAGSQLFVILWGRLLGAKIVLVDSFARFHAPSKFARLAGGLAHLRITQSQQSADRWAGSTAFDPLRTEPATADGKQPLLFATVGAILPLHRLERAVVELKQAGRIPEEVILQIGNSDLPRPSVPGLTVVETLPFDELQALLRRADLVVCHAGTGSIITALAQCCGVVAMPRRVDAGDSYDDHQSEIAEVFAERGLIEVAQDSATLAAALDRARSAPRHRAAMDHSALIAHLNAQIARWFPRRAGDHD